MKQCQAVQQSDQKVCFKCKQVWDMNDPHPPKCGPKKDPSRLSTLINNFIDPTKHDQNSLWMNAYILWFTGAAIGFGIGFFIMVLIKEVFLK